MNNVGTESMVESACGVALILEAHENVLFDVAHMPVFNELVDK